MGKSVPKKPVKPTIHDRVVTVAANTQVAGSIRRITFQGPETRVFLNSFRPADAVQAFMTMDGTSSTFPVTGDVQDNLSRMHAQNIVARVYTITDPQPQNDRFSFEVLAHGDAPGTRWACTARAGDRVRIAGPRYGYHIDDQAEAYVLIADDAAVPAAIEILKHVPESVPALALFATGLQARPRAAPTTSADHQIRWLRDAEPETIISELEAHRLGAAGGTRFWASLESGDLKQVRRYIRADLGISRADADFSAYWRRGRTLADSEIGSVPEELRAAFEAAGLHDGHDVDDVEPTVDLPGPRR